MTFGPHHYVPVLKVKLNEKKALGCISSTLQPRITPLLEIVKRKPEKAATVDAHLNTAFKNLANNVRAYPRCFLDAREIAADGAAAAAEVFRRASSEGIMFTPVTGISRTADVAAALSNRTHGVALRLTRDELESGGLPGKLRGFLARHGLAPEEIDLIVDLGPVDELIVDGVAALSNAFLADVPDHRRWRTFTVSACAFPQSMGGVGRQSDSLVERADWIAWRDRLHAMRGTLQRLPTFSDCAIQHPTGVEDFDFRTMQMSSSIRYTLADAWLLIKGESTRSTRPGVQFPALATKLAYGHLQPSFSGPTHCDGCAGTKAAADRAGGFGSAGAWRRLGTIHHVSMVMQGLASLPWP
jgi:hypothetical protein